MDFDHTHIGDANADCSPALTEHNLEDALSALGDRGRFFFADLQELNNSDADGGALLVLKGDQLTVITAAAGVEADEIHPQHIHGFPRGQNAHIPDLDQDDDRDGFIELAEGLETYGPILLNLTSPPGPEASGFPKPCGTTFLFSETYDLSDPANGEFARLLDNVSLDQREIVLHGLTTLRGHGAGTEGEVDGTAGYKIVLPIAAGEIQEMSREDALRTFQHNIELDINRTLVGNENNNQLTGNRGDDVIRGLAGNDRLSGSDGEDRVFGAEGRDLLFGDKDNDLLSGGDGNDRLVGGEGNDRLIGGDGLDAFVFRTDFGVDRVIGFDAGADIGDVLNVRGLFEDFEDVLASAEAFGTDSTIITLDADNKIILKGVTEAQLHENDFFFG